MKKRIVLSLVGSMTLAGVVSPLSSFASSPVTGNTFSQNKMIKSVQENKLVFKNGESLERKVDGKNKELYIASTKTGKYKFEKEKNIISIVSLKTGELVQKIDVNKLRSNAEKISNQKPAASKSVASISSASGSKYQYAYTLKLSSELYVTGASAIAGIIASIVGGPVTGIITTIATAYAGYKAKKVYWYEIYSRYVSGNTIHVQTIYTYWKYHDYTNYLGSVTKYSSYVGGPR